MKKILFALLFIFGALSVSAQSGLTCDDPIPVDSNYVGTVTKAGKYWYTAGTYDLPLNVHFTPTNPTSTANRPIVVIDLTCEPGVYADKMVDSLVNLVSDFDITFPAELRMETAGTEDNVEYDMYIDAMYREQLAKFGVTYNVQAYVQVTFYEPGEVSFRPDTVFSSCVDKYEHVVMGDSVSILPNNEDRVLVMPFTDWQNDSIQFVWTGTDAATVYLAAGNCEFAPSLSDGYVWKAFELQSNKPYRMSQQSIKDAIVQEEGGGIFFAKVLTSSAGKLLVEPIPMSPMQGDAKLLEYGKTITLAANDNSLYAFPKTWKATQFVGTSKFITEAYFSNTSEFTVVDDDAVVANYAFSLVDDVRDLSLSSVEMEAITKKATDDYVYVRFQCAQSTQITPWQWDASYCANKSTVIESASRFTVASRSANTIYRLRYDEWAGYDIEVKWSGSSALPVYIADTCSYSLSSTNSHVVKYQSVPKRSTVTLTADAVNSWASRVDADGFLYVRFNPTAQGNVTLTSSKPAEEDPVVPTDPCVINSLELKLGDKITLNLDSAFTVYSIKYADWLANGASLTWSGAEVLHTFVAETCEFYVAPYNKYVHAYVSVPATGNVLLDKTALENLAEYVDDNGYLYVRFLTEKEGVLEVK